MSLFDDVTLDPEFHAAFGLGPAPRKIFRLPDGTFRDDGSLLSCVIHFDENGAYVGQEQMNCMGLRLYSFVRPKKR